MDAGIKIACPKCGWEPNGSPYWTCSCDHSWNTFDTRGKCPNCGKQWKDTHCPRCGDPSEHETWYHLIAETEQPIGEDQIELRRRKEIIETKLSDYGIKNQKISYLPYLALPEKEFQTLYEVGCRILVLWAISYVASRLDEREEIESWLKRTALWDKVTESERKLFTDDLPQKVLINFSWRFEAVIVLCWAVNLLAHLPNLDEEIPEEELDDLMLKLPIGEDPQLFLNTLTYRDKEEVFIENITNEMITGYLRDMMLSGPQEGLKVNPSVSFERHFALNWVRKFSEISEWDETDTST
jgi:hypothetical protein